MVDASPSNTSAIFRDHGYVVLRNLLPPALVDELHLAVSHYVAQRGPRALPMSRAFALRDEGYDPVFISDVRSEPALSNAYTLAAGSPLLRATLSDVFNGRRAAFLGRNEIVVNRLLNWHRDMLDGELGAYTAGMDPWSSSSSYSIVAVAIFLQDHMTDRLGLVLQPGTHRHERASRRRGVTISSRRGDAIIFDTRLWHRSGQLLAATVLERTLKHESHSRRSAAAPRGDTSTRPSLSRRLPSEKLRALLTLSYGVRGSAFSAAHEDAMRMRYRLLTDPALCNITLGLRTRPRSTTPPAEHAAAVLCVRSAVANDMRARARNRSTRGTVGAPYKSFM